MAETDYRTKQEQAKQDQAEAEAKMIEETQPQIDAMTPSEKETLEESARYANLTPAEFLHWGSRH